MSGKRLRPSVAAFALCLAWFAVSPASAAPPPPPQNSQELNPVQRAPAPSKPAGNRDLLSAPEPGPCPLASSKLTFRLNSVTFNGAATITPETLAPAFADLVGHDVPLAALCEIRDRASTILFNEGLFARVEIPAQKISKGAVVLDVIEAYIASVRVQGDDSGAQSKVEDYIEMLRGMRPFNIRLAQRYLFLASDVPGVSIGATLRPAGKGRGAIELVITVLRKPVGAIANVQNFGAESTGPWGGLARVDFNGFTPFGERTTLVAYQTFDIREQRVVQAIEEGRIGDDGLLARGSFSWGESRPGGPVLGPIHFFGQSYVTLGELYYPVVRMRAENLSFTGGLEAVEQKITSGGLPFSQDHLRVFYLRMNGDISWRGEIPFKLDGNIEARQGAPILGASRKGDADLSRVQGDPEAFVLRGDARATASFFDQLTLTEKVEGQFANVPLLSYEEQSIGNLTIGRGYDPSALSGDRGVASATDLRWSPLPATWPVTGSIFGFFDAARIWNLDTGGVNKTVRSVGGGVTVDVLSRLHVETTYAHPMDKTSILASKRAPDRVLVSATVEY